MDIHNFICSLLIYLSYNAVIVAANLRGLFDEEFEPLFKTAASEFTHHEVVHPVIYKDNKPLVSTFDKNGHHDDIVIKFVSRDHNFVIPLKRNKHLFSKSYVEKSYKHNGTYNLHRPHHHKLRRHCFYHGYIWGAPHSLVALSTCDGISGYIDTGEEAFHIEPATDLGHGSHRLYNDAHSVRKPSTCGAHKLGHSTRQNETSQIEHASRVLRRRRRSIQEPYDATPGTRYVEMYIVNDYRTFDSNGRNIPRQNHKTQSIANIVSKLYQPFNIYIALVGIENWTTDDQITISTEADSTLENFLYYRKTRINPTHPNDNAQLITDTKFTNGVVGKAIKGTICTYQYSGGVNLNLATVGQTAATIAHELGHNFGMDHDNYTLCKCKEDKCIMAATSGGSRDNRINTPRHWSSCSMLTLQEAFEMGMDYCLRNKPAALYDGPVCGNSFTEEGEQCDCGLPEECNNKCCNASTCTLTSGSSCAVGGCCDLNTCQPKAAASPCRSSVGECDLPEFCWGDSPHCPADVYKQNGADCLGGQSYCYNGHCTTHTGQCKLLWGNTGRVSDPVCFKHLNTNGSKHGNCGYNWTTNQYEACLRDDVMCGLLHCVHQNEKLMFWKDNLAHATPATFLTIGTNTYVCRGAMLDVGLDMPDPGMVPDGAKCDDRKVCVDHKCTPLSHFNFPGCADGCSDRGVCNSKGHCHCDSGFGPPICDAGGNGGSVDSGPAEVHDDKSLLIALLVVFLVILPLLGLIAFGTYHFRADILAWWNAKIANKNKSQSRPLRPSRPPPKRDQPPPPPYKPPSYKDAVEKSREPERLAARPIRPNAPPASSNSISAPVLTGSTHKDTRNHIQTSPQRDHRQVAKTKPRLPERQVNQNSSQPPAKPSVELPQKKQEPEGGTKSLFAPFLKMPSFGRSTESSEAQSPKVVPKQKEEQPVEDIVKKRELTREISSPVLISTTDRRSKHYCQVDKLKVHQQPSSEDGKGRVLSPPVPPHVSLMRSESDTARRNRPLPPRPISMPESECGEEIELQPKAGRKSMAAGPSHSPRVPHRPPPPPDNKPTDLRQALEDELARIDDIEIQVVPISEPKTKPKPRPTMAKTNSDPAPKKPTPPSKTPAATSKTPATAASKTKPTKPKVEPNKWEPVQKPIFNPRSRPGLTGGAAAKKQPDTKKTPSNSGPSNAAKKPLLGDKNKRSGSSERKISAESMDEDGSSASAGVSGLTRQFEAQKKPLLGDKTDLKRTQSHSEPKAPMTPPKPRSGTKHVRSVNV